MTTHRAGLFLLLAAAVLTRFAGLGERFFHHDEAVHAWMARQISRGIAYQYDPVYHGPVLYHVESLVFKAAGDGDAQARVVSAACGVLLVALLYVLLAPRLGRVPATLAAWLAVVSPSLTYYSRFNSHDMIVAALSVVMVAAPFDFRRNGLVWCGLAAGLAISTKLNAYFILGALVLYVGCRAVHGRLRCRPREVARFVAENQTALAISAALCASIVVLLSVPTLVHHVASGQSVVRATVASVGSLLFGGFRYWWELHWTPRLAGPFHFYFPILFIYEPLLLVASAAALVHYAHRRLHLLVVVSSVLALEWVALSFAVPLREALAGVQTFGRWDVMLATAWLVAGGWSIVSLWDDGRDFLACWVFVAVTQLLLYSYANEKVPWLVVHIVVPWLVVVSAYLVDLWGHLRSAGARAALVGMVIALVAVSARASWIVNTRNGSNVAEPLVQVGYADAVSQTVRRIADLPRGPATPALVQIEPAVQWPFGWYLRDLPVEYLVRPVSSRDRAPILLAADGAVDPGLSASHTGTKLDYYHWTTWTANVARGDLRGLVSFALHHERWGQEAGVPFVLWVRKDVERESDRAGGVVGF